MQFRQVFTPFFIFLFCLTSAISFAQNNHASKSSSNDRTFKAASVEFNPEMLQLDKNILRLSLETEKAAKADAKLIVLPELATTGVLYHDRRQIEPFLDTIPGKATIALENVAKKYQTHIVVGIAEIDPITNLAYNAAALIGPKGYIGKYRKNHLNSIDNRWASKGNLGHPVFETELGKISLLICYDDAYLQASLLPILRGADILAFLTASDRSSLTDPDAQYHQSTIAHISPLSGWIGAYIVASSRTNIEANPNTGMIARFDGGAAIWDPYGNVLAQAPVSTLKKLVEPMTIYAKIDPKLFNNSAKQLQTARRPELYTALNLHHLPSDPKVSKIPQTITALSLQYEPIAGDKAANLIKIKKLLQKAHKKGPFNLSLLPENCLTGNLDPMRMRSLAESLKGETVEEFKALAREYNSYIAFGMVESSKDKYYETTVLLDNQGNMIGSYRKTHLSPSEQRWATAGDTLTAFNTNIGKIGIIMGDEVRMPDLTAVMAAKRADIILIPSSWAGNYGGPVQIDNQFLSIPYPRNTMYMWYNVAKYAKAYALVSNFVGTKEEYKGSSGLYSINPVQGRYNPQLASPGEEIAFRVDFKTLAEPDAWMNQHHLTVEGRSELNVPLTLKKDDVCFLEWQKNSTGNDFCWDH